MKKWVSLLLALILALSLFPMGALADGNDSNNYYVYEYNDLEPGLKSGAGMIMIYPWHHDTTMDEIEYFDDTWPSEPAVVDLDASGDGASIMLAEGSITIPSNVTVNATDAISFTGDDTLVINGTWNMVTNQGRITCVTSGDDTLCGNVIVGESGTITTAAGLGSADPVAVEDFTVNGTIQCGQTGTNTYLRNAKLGSSAKVTGGTLWLAGTLTGPSSGYPVIDTKTYIAPSTGDVTLAGNLHITSLSINNDATVHIASGSHVVVDELYFQSGVGAGLTIEEGGHLTVNGISVNDEDIPLNIAGTLEVTAENAQVSKAVFTMDGGTIILRPGVSFGSKTGTGEIKGTGQLRLYAWLKEDGTPEDQPTVYGLDTRSASRESFTKIESGVTFWKNWEDAADCEHVWVKGAVTAPTCGVEGYTVYSCTECLSDKKGDLVDATWQHVLTTVENDGSLIRSCENCDYYVSVSTSEDGTELYADLNYLKQGDHVVAAVYDAEGKLLGVQVRTMRYDGGARMSLSLDSEALPATLKVFVTAGGWEAKRPAEEFEGILQQESA